MKRLDVAKIQINEASKVFYTSEIKTEKLLRAGYRTFDLKKIQSIHAVNYDWGKYDKIPSAAQRKIDEQKKKLDDEIQNNVCLITFFCYLYNILNTMKISYQFQFVMS